MKKNVDLTDNQIFSSYNNSFFNLIDIRLLLGNIVGVQKIKNDYDLIGNPGNEVYFTGNHEQREEKRYYQQDKLKELYCDCCGKQLIYVPYRKFNYPLCKECEREFEEKRINFRLNKRFRIPYYDIIYSQEEEAKYQKPLDNIFLWD